MILGSFLPTLKFQNCFILCVRCESSRKMRYIYNRVSRLADIGYPFCSRFPEMGDDRIWVSKGVKNGSKKWDILSGWPLTSIHNCLFNSLKTLAILLFLTSYFLHSIISFIFNELSNFSFYFF